MRFRPLMLCQGLEVGGLESMVCELCRGLRARGHEPEVCCYDALGAYAEDLRGRGVCVHLLRRRPGVDWGYAFRLARLVRGRAVDLVHAHNATAWFYGAWAAFLARRPLVYTEHDRSFPPPPRIQALHRLLARLTRAVVAVSGEVADNLRRYEGIDDVRVIPNGVDGHRFRPASEGERSARRRALGLGEGEVVLGTVGRLDPLKDHRLLIEAVTGLEGSWRLLVVGDGPLRAELERLVQERSLGGRVVFLGERRDVPELLRAMDAFVLPSRSEGLPMALLEAMACGLPVVATRVGGIPEAVREGEGGLLCDPGDSGGLRDALCRLISDPPLRRRLGRGARVAFERRFSLQRMVEGYERLYLSLLGRREQRC